MVPRTGVRLAGPPPPVGAPLLILLLLLLAAPLAAQDVGGIAVGSRAPAIRAIDLQGRLVQVAPAGRQPTLIEFWAAWCEYCARLEPRMKAAYARYGGDVRFLVVAVNVNESLARVARTAAHRDLPYPVVYDSSGAATRAYDVPATSFIVIADAGGRIAYTGQGDGQDLDAALGHILQSHAGGTP